MLAPLTRPGLFSPAECAEIVALAAAAGFRAGGLTGGRQNRVARQSGIAWLDEAQGAAWVAVRLARAAAEANRERFGFDLGEFAEAMQVARYRAADGGHFDWHMDVGEGPLAGRRKLTLVVQLSDPADYAGGALETLSGATPLAAPRTQGTGILFPAFLLHRVAPVTGGERLSLTSWVHGPPFR
jgi:PKHD-type hydroxylase